MRKNFLTLFLLVLIPVSINAYRPDTNASIPLQGGYGDVCSVDVEILKAQAQGYMGGMPFYIKDNSVQPSSSGRGIANWSILANNHFNIMVKAEPLHSVEKPEYKLNYELIFQYELETIAPGGEPSIDSKKNFSVKSSDDSSEIGELNPVFSFTDEFEAQTFIGSVDGMIFFRFSDSTTGLNDAPIGEYTATVEIMIEAGE